MNLEFNLGSLKEQFTLSFIFTPLLLLYNIQGQKTDAELKALAKFLKQMCYSLKSQ